MRCRIACWTLLGLFFLTRCSANNENRQRNLKDKLLGHTNYNSFGDDIYLDDQDSLEGSGRSGGEIRDDLEASGSGLGPDDEDGDGGEFTNHNTIEPILNKPVEPKVIEETIYKNKQTSIDAVNRPDSDNVEPSSIGEDRDVNSDENRDVYIMNPKTEDRASSFFAQPGVLAAVIGGAVVGLLCAILVVMFIVYRMRKKDEGSYALDEPRRSPAANSYPKPGATQQNREFYA